MRLLRMRHCFIAAMVVNLPLQLKAETAPSTASFVYPELLVTPSASQRLQDEAKRESEDRFSKFWPIQTSALTTIVAGASALGEKDEEGELRDSHYAGQAAIVVGAGWLVTTSALALYYRPYGDGVARLKKFGGSGKQQQLGRERMAEEALREPAALAVRLKWLSVISHFAASVAVAGGSKDRMTQALGGVAALASVTPWLFPLSWEKVWDYHDEYKRKIYGPLTGGFMLHPVTQKPAPGLMLSLNF